LDPWWVDDDCVKESTMSMETIEIAGAEFRVWGRNIPMLRHGKRATI
jgi:hypothetical protein